MNQVQSISQINLEMSREGTSAHECANVNAVILRPPREHKKKSFPSKDTVAASAINEQIMDPRVFQ